MMKQNNHILTFRTTASGKNGYGFLSIITVLSVFFFYVFGTSAEQTVNDAYPPGYYADDLLPDKTVYLTFDDGPSDWTDNIRDTLEKENIKATFFICGDWAPHANRIDNDFKKYRDVLIRMIKDGHSLGNHTIDHKNLAVLTPDQITRQLDENQELLNRELGKDAVAMTLMRPPFGSPWYRSNQVDVQEKVGRAVKSKGIVVMWSRHSDSSDSIEWAHGEWYEKSPRIYTGDEDFKRKMHRIYARLIDRANGKGMVILFHDTHPTTMIILPAIIERLKSEGYRFDTIENFVKWRYGKSSSEIIRANTSGKIRSIN